MRITFLGTAGSIMAENKGYPSILINDDILLDCGEGTTQKLIQVKSIERIKIICITHLHNDHFMGLFSLLWHLWIKKRKKNLEIIGPVGLKHAIETILVLSNTPDDLRSFDIVYTEIVNTDKTQFRRDDYTIKSVKVEHGIPALAFRIEKDGTSLCYTGDSKPIKDLENLAKECDMLISESTLPEKFADFAHEHYHMTPVDAAELALESKCKKLVLFHISSYFLEFIDSFKTEAESIFREEVIIAEDFMELEIK